jgi:ribosomal protein S21
VTGIATAMRQQDEPTREALRDLRARLVAARDGERPARQYHIPMDWPARPAHAVVALPVGATDLADLDKALKILKKQTPWYEIKRREYYMKPGEKRRRKQLRARARLRKVQRRQAGYDARQEAAGH